MANWNLRGRGEDLENLILASNLYYHKHNVCRIDKAATPIKVIETSGSKITEAYFEKKSTVDFYGIVQGIFVVFDAKQTAINSLPLKNIHEHQIHYMNDIEKQGGISFLIVEFTSIKKFYILPYEILNDYYERSKQGGRKSIPISAFPKELEIQTESYIRLKYLESLNTYLDWKEEYNK